MWHFYGKLVNCLPLSLTPQPDFSVKMVSTQDVRTANVSAACLIVRRRLLRLLYIASGALLPLDCHSRPEYSAAFFKTFWNRQKSPLQPLRPESSNGLHPLQGHSCQPTGTENLDIFKKAGQNLESHLVRKKMPLVFLQLTIFESLRYPPSCHHGHQ